MKKIVFLLAICGLFIGCTENRVRSTATEYLKKQMKDPSSFKIEKAEVVLDTIPLFLNKQILSCAEDVSNAIDEKNRYKDRDSYLWRKEIERASEKLTNAFLNFSLEYQAQKKKERSVQYLVLINCSANNSYGSLISGKFIVIVDKNNTDKVLGEYNLDSDFAKKFVTAYIMTGNGDLEQNEFGKVETENLSSVEKFIFADE